MVSDAQRAARAAYKKTSRYSPPKWRPGGVMGGRCFPDQLSTFVDARAPLEADGLAAYLRDWGSAGPEGKPITAKKISDMLQRPLPQILAVLHAMRDAGRVTYSETGWLLA